MVAMEYTKMFLIYLILFLYQINLESCSIFKSNYTFKIVNGVKTDITKHPYMVNIIKELEKDLINCLCAGTIISSRWILTSAHCTKTTSNKDKYVPYTLSIIAGSTTCFNIENEGQKRRIEKLTIHPNFLHKEDSEINNNIALLYLEKVLIFGIKIRPVKLITPLILNNDSPIKDNMYCEAMGWGLRYEGDTSAPELFTVQIPLISSDECVNLIKKAKINVNSSNIYCTLDEEHKKGICFGDTGGPLMCANYQIGVVTEEVGCANKNSPTVWTRVDMYYKWIKLITDAKGPTKHKYMYNNTSYLHMNTIFLLYITLLNIF